MSQRNRRNSPDTQQASRWRNTVALWGLTQQELAERAGISRPDLSAIKNGQAPLPRGVGGNGGSIRCSPGEMGQGREADRGRIEETNQPDNHGASSVVTSENVRHEWARTAGTGSIVWRNRR
jgi:hypothetical protein